MYLEQIQNSLTDSNWKAIFEALYQLQEARTRQAKVEAGAVTEEYEPLLPADPPTLSPA